MSIGAASESGWVPWSHRLFAFLPVAPAWVGAGLVLLAAVVLVAVTGVTGELQAYRESGEALVRQRDARLVVILCVLVGFLPTVQEYLLRFTRANLAALEPLLGPARLELPRPGFLRCTLPGILAMPLIAFSIDRDVSLYFSEEYLNDANHFFQWAFGLFVTVNLARTSHLSVACGRAVGNRADELPRIDLLDLAPLAPFARQVVQTALVWLLMLSVFSVNAVDPGFAPAVAVIAIYTGVNVAAAWQVCHRRIHRRIHDAKNREIGRINDALRGDAAAMAGLCVGGPGEGLGVADLLAYRRFVDGVREWAFDPSSRLRIALYLAIPLGSWLGGAIVERLLDATLR